MYYNLLKGEAQHYRSPININTASWPVLVAIIQGLKSDTGVEITREEAIRWANQICVRRRTVSFTGWDDLRQFFKDHYLSAFSSSKEEKYAILIGNFDANVTNKKYNPDKVVYQDFTKLDLSYYTTEITFFPDGYFEITSLGKVLDSLGDVISQRKIFTAVKIFGLMRQYTQHGFEKNQRETFEERKKSRGFSHFANLQKSDADIDAQASKKYGYVEPLTYAYDADDGKCLYGGNKSFYEGLCFRGVFNGSLNAFNHNKAEISPKDSPASGLTKKTTDDLAADGVVFGAENEEDTALCYKATDLDSSTTDNIPDEDGVVMFWVKFRRSSNSTVFFATTHIEESDYTGSVGFDRDGGGNDAYVVKDDNKLKIQVDTNNDGTVDSTQDFSFYNGTNKEFTGTKWTTGIQMQVRDQF